MSHTRLPRLLGVLLSVLAAAGCVSVAEMENLEARITDAGYTDVGVGHIANTNGFDTVTVRAINPSTTEEGADIARLVWHTYPEEVDEVVVTLNGISRSATREEMLQAFGPRQLQPNPDEDTDLGDILVRVVVVVLILVVLIKVLSLLGRLRRR
ncbi:hypothetical protein ACFYOT_19565 [Saccharothrix saharensis]|uniref:hypothetical protein n=1 Tax=Saccharothrix saharensis TaxID=571190 RepID=UPI0036799929